MSRVLFVSNGHGEESIAARIAGELAPLDPSVQADHLALVGTFGHPSVMRDVGPRRAMPSGGLIAMGNVRNIVRDVRGGLVGLTLAQLRFLRESRGSYDVAVAVGDVFALGMALQTRAQVVFVGTAKSVHVAPYGRFEESLVRKARDVIVRDAPTAQRLRDHGIDARAGNVIVDLFAAPDDPRAEDACADFAPLVALLPGSRASAYEEARALLHVFARINEEIPGSGAVMSIAPGLDLARFTAIVAEVGSNRERETVRLWRGDLGPILARATIAVGQAGTANEAAAAGGVPVVALERPREKREGWYRMRQRGLLGDALRIVDGDPDVAARDVIALLNDASLRAHMGAVGRERMGPPGAAHAIARRIHALLSAA